MTHDPSPKAWPPAARPLPLQHLDAAGVETHDTRRPNGSLEVTVVPPTGVPSSLTTLAGYVHWKLTGQPVLGVGEASGMFPINSKTNDYDKRMLKLFNEQSTSISAPGSTEKAGDIHKQSTGIGQKTP